MEMGPLIPGKVGYGSRTWILSEFGCGSDAWIPKGFGFGSNYPEPDPSFAITLDSIELAFPHHMQERDEHISNCTHSNYSEGLLLY